MGYEFYIEEGVFIPRSVTEELVEIAIDLVRNLGLSL
ncbi:MAG: peptide chain release factor N(5)-glutamine methyltransferase, partial [Thermotoga sp.]